MSDHVYQLTELTGTSKTSIEEAVQAAIAQAAKTLPNPRWFQVTEMRGAVNGDKVAEWQVTVKIGYRLED